MYKFRLPKGHHHFGRSENFIAHHFICAAAQHRLFVSEIKKMMLLVTPQMMLASPNDVVPANADTNKKIQVFRLGFFCGGERGIRTLGTVLAFTRFPIVRLRPAQPTVHIRNIPDTFRIDLIIIS